MLAASRGGVRKTYLMYQCNLSFRQMKNYLRFMLKKGLVQPVQEGLFEVTEKGRRFLKAYKRLKVLMK
jgi:predicted transcriptional regulator